VAYFAVLLNNGSVVLGHFCIDNLKVDNGCEGIMVDLLKKTFQFF
jgi:hypothetical protein